MMNTVYGDGSRVGVGGARRAPARRDRQTYPHRRAPSINGEYVIPRSGGADATRVSRAVPRGAHGGGASYFAHTRAAARVDAKGKRAFRDVRREASRRRRFALRRRALIMGIAIVLVFVALLAAVYKAVFRVTDISATEGGRYTPDEIIAASGISEGTNLYSFRKSSVVDSITLQCPYIGDVDIDRQIPHSVVLNTTEDEPHYSVSIFGEAKLLSEGLRVLGSVESTSETSGVVRLHLPGVSYAIDGRVIAFSDSRCDRSVRDVLSSVADSELASRITAIDIRDIYNISMTCDDKYKLIIGDTSRLDMKLLTAARVLEDDMFKTDNKMRIDLTADGKTGIIIDNKLELD